MGLYLWYKPKLHFLESPCSVRLIIRPNFGKIIIPTLVVKQRIFESFLREVYPTFWLTGAWLGLVVFRSDS